MNKMKLAEATGETVEVAGRLLPVTSKQPPKMSRRLNGELFEYRSTATCPECLQSVVYCNVCTQALPVDTREYCREHSLPLEPLYVYRYNSDPFEIRRRPISACPSCHAISWWADEDYDFDSRKGYFAGLKDWVSFEEGETNR